MVAMGSWKSNRSDRAAPSRRFMSLMSRVDSNPRAIIAEDEEVLREQLRERLSALWPQLEIAAEVEDGIAALHALEARTPDILFLDIQMPGLSGLEVAHHAS